MKIVYNQFGGFLKTNFTAFSPVDQATPESTKSSKSDSDESESSKSDNNDNDDDGLSGGAIFGIIVANLFVLGLICFCCSKCNENNDDKICIVAIFSSE